MDVKLITISEYSSEILTENTIHLEYRHVPCLKELLDGIWDLFPYLYHEEDFDLYWRYSENKFLRVYDYYSYFTALVLMSERRFYMVLRDSIPWIFDEKTPQITYDVDILKEALEGTRQKYYTKDHEQRFRIMNDIRRGMPKTGRAQLVLPDDNVINQRAKTKGPGSDKGGKKK